MYDAQFRHRLGLTEDAIDEAMNYTATWVDSRYDIPRESYLSPDRFAREEIDDDWDLNRTMAIINLPYLDSDFRESIRYYWKKVQPSLENPENRRRHGILVDIETQKEAPLLPGLKPYRNVESIAKS
jgi:hypothetical protein